MKLDNPHPHKDTRLARKLSNGSYLIGNCHAGPGQPLLISLDPKTKTVDWQLDEFEKFGNAVSNSLSLDVVGKSIR